MSSNALVLENVSKKYGTTTVVDSISFSARSASVLALLGPNGAGKTTTIEMCEGFISPSSGLISVLGHNPASHPQAIRDRVGIMLQSGGSYSGIRVREMLQLSAAYNKNPHNPDWLLQILGLEGVATTTYRRLSGGQRQRLSLALAIIGRPELVFLDEPTAGMDAQSRNAVWELITALRRDGVTIVLTTHLMDEAESLADDVVIMDRGKIVATGTPAELTSKTAEDVVTFSTAQPVNPKELDYALSKYGMTCSQIRPLRYTLQGRFSPVVNAALAQALVEQGVLLRDLSVSHRNLEDVFLEITGRELRS